MKILSIKVEEGFLDGLNLSFTDGLNTIIGPRGVGKTSIIELIRYCLSLNAYSQKIDERARNHALSILGSGQVTLTVEVDNLEYDIIKTVDDRETKTRFDHELPILLSQGEIESIGLHDRGKLRLIDNFTESPQSVKIEELSITSEIKSISTQIGSLIEEQTELSDEIAELKDINKQLESAKKEQKDFSGTIKGLQKHQSELSQISNKSSSIVVQIDIFRRTIDNINSYNQDLQNLAKNSPRIEEWPEIAGEKDLLNNSRKSILNIKDALIKQAEILAGLVKDISQNLDQTTQEKINLESKARELRAKVEEVQEGAGALARKVSNLEEKKGQLEALRSLEKDKEDSITSLKEIRASKLNSLEELRNIRYERRNQVIHNLNAVLLPTIELRLVRSSQLSEYENAIIETLRGSGLRYRSLAPRLAKSISPRELAELIEESNADQMASSADISIERANRIITFAKTKGVDEILSTLTEDGVNMSLLVGSRYQPIENLSTGQRATVILPILLCDHGRPLIIDQPEDNLDNEFIVDTVIKAMLKATNSNQIICSTHNPNIPVLGNASQVTLLNSDGQRGFVRSSEILDHPESIKAITTIMEGGKEAFLRRAEFYASQVGTDE